MGRPDTREESSFVLHHSNLNSGDHNNMHAQNQHKGKISSVSTSWKLRSSNGIQQYSAVFMDIVWSNIVDQSVGEMRTNTKMKHKEVV